MKLSKYYVLGLFLFLVVVFLLGIVLFNIKGGSANKVINIGTSLSSLFKPDCGVVFFSGSEVVDVKVEDEGVLKDYVKGIVPCDDGYFTVAVDDNGATRGYKTITIYVVDEVQPRTVKNRDGILLFSYGVTTGDGNQAKIFLNFSPELVDTYGLDGALQAALTAGLRVAVEGPGAKVIPTRGDARTLSEMGLSYEKI